MAFQPAPNVAEFTINQRLHGELVQNTLHAIRNPDWDAATLSNAVAALSVWFEQQALPTRSTNLQAFGIEARSLTVENGPVASFTYPPVTLGGNPSPGLPSSVALCISFRSGLAGRSARGRNYIAGLSEDQVGGNLVIPAFIDAQLDAYNLLPGVFSAFGAIHVILSRFANKVARPSAFAFAVQSYTVTDGFVDSQRRRLTQRGQ